MVSAVIRILAPHDSNVVLYAQVCWLFCVFHMPLFSLVQMFSRESFDTKYTQAILMDLLTDWQVIIQSVFPVSQERSLNNKETSVVGFFPASPHSLLVSFPNVHDINSSARRGFQEQKPTTRSLRN